MPAFRVGKKEETHLHVRRSIVWGSQRHAYVNTVPSQVSISTGSAVATNIISTTLRSSLGLVTGYYVLLTRVFFPVKGLVS